MAKQTKNKRALTACESTNMYGGAHETNIDVARKAAREGRDIIIHSEHYDGQRYYYSRYRVADIQELSNGQVVGVTSDGDTWEATGSLCDYAQSGRI